MNFVQYLGIRVVTEYEDGITAECLIRKEYLNMSGVLHGGVTASVADSAMGIAVSQHYGKHRSVTTAEFKINYLCPLKDGKVVARAKIIRAGKKICVGQVEVSDASGTLIAIALMTFAVKELEFPSTKSTDK